MHDIRGMPWQKNKNYKLICSTSLGGDQRTTSLKLIFSECFLRRSKRGQNVGNKRGQNELKKRLELGHNRDQMEIRMSIEGQNEIINRSE